MKTKRIPRKASAATGDKPKDTAELNVVRMKLSQLKPHPKNPRVHPKPGTPSWDTLRASLEHDYFDPLVWNTRNGMLVSGHLRRKVFTAMGIKQADVVVVDYPEHTHLARMLAANKSIGEDDLFKLGEIMNELGAVEDFDFALTGFTLGEVQGLTPPDEDPTGEADESAPEGYSSDDIDSIGKFFGEGAKPTVDTALKQVWRVGANFLYIGSVLSDHLTYVPLLSQLAEEFPERKVMLVPMPDPIMIGHSDKRIAAVFVQPSPLAASLALSLIKKKTPKHIVKLISHENKPAKKTAKKTAKRN